MPFAAYPFTCPKLARARTSSTPANSSNSPVFFLGKTSEGGIERSESAWHREFYSEKSLIFLNKIPHWKSCGFHSLRHVHAVRSLRDLTLLIPLHARTHARGKRKQVSSLPQTHARAREAKSWWALTQNSPSHSSRTEMGGGSTGGCWREGPQALPPTPPLISPPPMHVPKNKTRTHIPPTHARTDEK